MRSMVAPILVMLFLTPIVGAASLSAPVDDVLIPEGYSTEMPQRIASPWTGLEERPWWEITSWDENRNGIQDSIESMTGRVNVGISYSRSPTVEDIHALGQDVHVNLHSVNTLLIGDVDVSEVPALASLDGVVMVQRYGSVVFWGDVQTQAVKARNSTEYPNGAWELGVSGDGVNIAMVDTGVDNEHPGLVGRFIAGYDAVCYMHSDLPRCMLAGAGAREDDGSFDPDDGNQHGTACIGMAAASGLEADGSQSEYYGSAPEAGIVDVRIGTDVGAGPFENYLVEQEAYESAMNGIQWIIDNKDTAWSGADEDDHGIDILSLSWGITSHENGGSDGQEMHSLLLDEAMEAGVVVSVAAGNDGPSNDGLSGMGSSSLSVTVGATDDQDTINRTDDTIADYSSRGPRRDNGDNNPINELKPDVSAPGTNIVQAEACVTSGGCNNNVPGQDASDNTYTGRGSGTSYATPAVSGIMALMWEANPALSTAEIREILRVTAEPRGEPTYPEIDPVWNRDFGWGMVDARAAVEMAIQLNESGLSTELLDIDMQLRTSSDELNGSIHRIDGIAWARTNTLSAVEYRIDGGEWQEAVYEIDEGGQSALVPVNWSITLDVDRLSNGNHTIEVRAVGPAGQSLPLTYQVQGTGAHVGEEADSMGRILFLGALFLLVLVVGGYASWQQAKENSGNPSVQVVIAEEAEHSVVLDAELAPESTPEESQ